VFRARVDLIEIQCNNRFTRAIVPRSFREIGVSTTHPLLQTAAAAGKEGAQTMISQLQQSERCPLLTASLLLLLLLSGQGLHTRRS
jgi:hypothetical protein